MKKVVLNIANNYFGTTVFKNLIEVQKSIGLGAALLIFLEKTECKELSVPKDCLLLQEPKIINLFFKIFPTLRFYYHKNKILNFINLYEIKSVHSHTLHSNGTLGHMISNHLGASHVLSLRNTDINFAIKFFRHLMPLYARVLNSSSVVTSPNLPYKNLVKQKFSVETQFLPNPIDNFWENSRVLSENRSATNLLRVCTLGEINTNKNQLNVLKALEELKLKCEYTLIGDIADKSYFDRLKNEARSVRIKHVGYISDRQKLYDLLLKQSVMCLVSFKETFGLSYIECALMGLPVVYSKGQGIDGILEDGLIGFRAQPSSVEQIGRQILSSRDLKRTSVAKVSRSLFNQSSYIQRLRNLYE